MKVPEEGLSVSQSGSGKTRGHACQTHCSEEEEMVWEMQMLELYLF